MAWQLQPLPRGEALAVHDGNSATREVNVSHRAEKRGRWIEVISCEPQKNELAGPASTGTAATDLGRPKATFRRGKQASFMHIGSSIIADLHFFTET